MRSHLLLALILASQIVGAATIPDKDRAQGIYDIFTSEDSVKSIIQEIKDGVLDPFYLYPWPYDLDRFEPPASSPPGGHPKPASCGHPKSGQPI